MWAFGRGIDLTSCKLPTEGYLRIPRPRASYGRALSIVEAEWTGKEREWAVTYLRWALQQEFTVEQPLHVIRPVDFERGPKPVRNETGLALVRVLERAAREIA